MYKCGNGTYCPPGSAAPIKCPSGSFGTGIAENTNINVACSWCGRGLYSSDKTGAGICFDCTPGYVCLGNTTSSMPTSIANDKGYICPAGYYCPRGSYKETPCPIGTFNFNTGKGALQDCIQCLSGYYGDQLGQSGCKKCGPSSVSDPGSQTCTCIGANRVFVKSTGSCLCKNGF